MDNCLIDGPLVAPMESYFVDEPMEDCLADGPLVVPMEDWLSEVN